MRSDSFWAPGCDWRDEEPSTGWEAHCRECCSIASFAHVLEDALPNVPNECPHCGSGIDKPSNPWAGRRNGIVESFGWDS